MTQERDTFRVADCIEPELRLFQRDIAEPIRGLDYPDAGEDALLSLLNCDCRCMFPLQLAERSPAGRPARHDHQPDAAETLKHKT